MSVNTSLPRDNNFVPLQDTFRNLASGNATVVTAGTPVQLNPTSTVAVRLDITANTTNATEVTVGGSGVVGAASGRKGVPIEPGFTYTFNVTDLSTVWLDSVTSGDGVTYNYFW